MWWVKGKRSEPEELISTGGWKCVKFLGFLRFLGPLPIEARANEFNSAGWTDKAVSLSRGRRSRGGEENKK
jgi:hypothetical protein